MPEIFCESTGETAKDYSAYLKTKHWANIRLDMAGERCLICDREKTNIHHRNYDNLGHEEPEDVIALCPVHHMIAHDLPVPKKYRHKGLEPPKRKRKRKSKKQRRAEKLKKKTAAIKANNSKLKYVEKTEGGLVIKVYDTP